MTSPVAMTSGSTTSLTAAAAAETLPVMLDHWYIILTLVLLILILLAIILVSICKFCFGHRRGGWARGGGGRHQGQSALSSAIRGSSSATAGSGFGGGCIKSATTAGAGGGSSGAGSLMSISSVGSGRSAAPLIQRQLSAADVAIPERRLSSRGSIDPGQLRSECYTTDESVSPTTDDAMTPTSTASGLPVSHSMLGTLHFAVAYDEPKSALAVTVVKATDLRAAKDPDAPNPYVKVQLLPDKRQKAKTKIVRRTQNPVYDETFTFFGIEPADLRQTGPACLTVHLAVFNFDSHAKHELLGELTYTLNGVVELIEREHQQHQHRIDVSLPLCPRMIKTADGQLRDRGELLVSLCYQPAVDRLTVIVLKARNLPRMDITGLSDPYVKVYLYYNGQRIAKKKTHVKKRTLNPIFNESFQLDLPPTSCSAADVALSGVRLEFVVYDWDRVTRNEIIGRVELGGDPSVEGHWKEVVNCPRKQIAEWHQLKE
jgi:hypothetical protein